MRQPDAASTASGAPLSALIIGARLHARHKGALEVEVDGEGGAELALEVLEAQDVLPWLGQGYPLDPAAVDPPAFRFVLG